MVGCLTGIKRLIIRGHPGFLSKWKKEELANIEYLELDNLDHRINLKYYTNLKKCYIKDEYDDSLPGDKEQETIVTESIRPSSYGLRTLESVHERLKMYIDTESYAIRSVYSPSFLNLKVLNLNVDSRERHNDPVFKIDCRNLPVLEELHTNKGAVIRNLSASKRLEQLFTSDTAMYDSDSDSGSDDQDIDKKAPNKRQKHRYVISNPMLQRLELVRKRCYGVGSLTVESKWLKVLIITIKEKASKAIDTLILHSPYVEELDFRLFKKVEIVGYDNFTYLKRYTADILLNLEESRDTLQSIRLPQDDGPDTSHLNRERYPRLITKGATLVRTMRWLEKSEETKRKEALAKLNAEKSRKAKRPDSDTEEVFDKQRKAKRPDSDTEEVFDKQRKAKDSEEDNSSDDADIREAIKRSIENDESSDDDLPKTKSKSKPHVVSDSD